MILTFILCGLEEFTQVTSVWILWPDSLILHPTALLCAFLLCGCWKAKIYIFSLSLQVGKGFLCMKYLPPIKSTWKAELALFLFGAVCTGLPSHEARAAFHRPPPGCQGAVVAMVAVAAGSPDPWRRARPGLCTRQSHWQSRVVL